MTDAKNVTTTNKKEEPYDEDPPPPPPETASLLNLKKNWNEWKEWIQQGDDDGDDDDDDDVDANETKTTKKKRRNILPPKYRLVGDQTARQYSMWSLQLAVLCSSINTKMLNPNFAIMSTPGAHPDDSFDNTDPFAFNSATYFLPMTTLLGVAISSVFIGTISDKIGRKKVILFMSWVSTVGSIVKYFSRDTFWGFCAANFAVGFFLGNLPVAMAYIGDIFTDKEEKERQFSVIVGNYVLGNSGGGIIAILMNGSGLFSALWVGAGLMFLSALFTMQYMIEPGDARLIEPKIGNMVMEEEDEAIKRPEKIDSLALLNIACGALLDNFGSTGLFPLCLSPLALEAFYFSFVSEGEEPILSITGYQWLSVCVALLVVPSTFITPWTFRKVGVAGTCVFGNACTAIITGALLGIGSISPATTGTFAAFVIVMYGGFPFTVLSQLTTGPMLDQIAPVDKLGFVQGLNNSTMNFGMAIAPWLLGVLADQTGTSAAIWTGIALSISAALVNAPLMYRKGMGRPPVKIPFKYRAIPGEDDEVVQKLVDGEYVNPQQVFEISKKRALEHHPAIVRGVRSYEQEKDKLDDLMKEGVNAFRFRQNIESQLLAVIEENGPEKVEEICDVLNTIYGISPEDKERNTHDMGQWIADYLLDNGYNPHVQTTSLKLMIMAAFPTITNDQRYSPENIKDSIVRTKQVDDRYLKEFEDQGYELHNVFGSGHVPVYYS